MTVLPVGNIATLAWWKLTAAHKPAAPDSTGHGHTAALSKDAAVTCTATAAPDGHKCSLSVTGGGGQALTAPATMPVAGNDGSFSVSAWKDLAKCQGTCVALAGDATHSYEFALKYQHSCQASGRTGPCWKFAMPVSDSSGATVLAAVSAPGSARLNRWVQLHTPPVHQRNAGRPSQQRPSVERAGTWAGAHRKPGAGRHRARLVGPDLERLPLLRRTPIRRCHAPVQGRLGPPARRVRRHVRQVPLAAAEPATLRRAVL